MNLPAPLFVCLSVLVCGTYVVHHRLGAGLCCALPTCIVHHLPALCTSGTYVHEKWGVAPDIFQNRCNSASCKSASQSWLVASLSSHWQVCFTSMSSCFIKTLNYVRFLLGTTPKLTVNAELIFSFIALMQANTFLSLVFYIFPI